MSERDEWRGQLAVAEDELVRTQTLWDGKMRAIRLEADPLKAIPDIDTALLQEYAKDLGLLRRKYDDLVTQVSKLKKMLYG